MTYFIEPTFRDGRVEDERGSARSTASTGNLTTEQEVDRMLEEASGQVPWCSLSGSSRSHRQASAGATVKNSRSRCRGAAGTPLRTRWHRSYQHHPEHDIGSVPPAGIEPATHGLGNGVATA